MKKLVFQLALACIGATALNGQNCPESPVYFLSQAQIDNFLSTYPDCTEIRYDMTIQGADIRDLGGLKNIKVIQGGLSVSDNDLLESFRGLENLEKINAWVRIQSNRSIRSFDGLQNLKTIGDYIYIAHMPSLTAIDSLVSLDSIHGSIHIYDMDSLKSLQGLESLSYIGDNLGIFRNNILKSLQGLESLKEIGQDMRLDDNPALESVESLDHPITINGWLVISKNPLLTHCAVESVCAHIRIPQSRKAISENGEGCHSLQAVETGCAATAVSAHLPAQIHTYPNPATERFYIQGFVQAAVREVSVYDMQGRRIILQGSGDGSFDIQALPAGSYWGRFQEQGKVYSFRFLKI